MYIYCIYYTKLIEGRTGSYHARDGLKRDVRNANSPINLLKKVTISANEIVTFC